MKKEIIIKEIRLLNFKGLRNQKVEFIETTSIFGENGTGKSTIFDAFTWLLFGKDSQDRTNFEVKTLDKNNNPIQKIDHEVTAVLLVDKVPVELKRILREKWVKSRGAAKSEFAGNETLYSWNDVPMQAKEFQAKIAGICDENIFKLITNPLAFSTDRSKWGWKERREVLLSMCPVSNEDLEVGNTDFDSLRSLDDSQIEEERKRVAARRKKLNDDLKTIPTRIDEVSRNKPESLDFDSIRKDISAKKVEINLIDSQIEDKSKIPDAVLAAIKKHQNDAHEVGFRMGNIEFDTKQEARNLVKQTAVIDDSEMNRLKAVFDNKKATLDEYKDALPVLESRKTVIEKSLEDLRSKWIAENARTFTLSEDECKCPTCNRAFEAEDIEEKKASMLENFNKDKAAKIKAIDASGMAQKEEKEKLAIRISKGKEVIAKMEPEVEVSAKKYTAENERIANLKNATSEVDPEKEFDANYTKILSENEEYKSLQAKLEDLKSNPVEAPKVDVTAFKEEKEKLQKEIESLQKDLLIEQTIQASNDRIAELETEESQLSQQIMEIEGKEFAIESFIKSKIETLEKKINSHFKYVTFKLFDTQVNGGISETCEALIEGVPFSNANTASRINGGLDIINSLCEFYQVTAPIFIDNRESIVDLIATDSQVINLIVKEGSELSVGKPKYTKEYLASLNETEKKELHNQTASIINQ